MQEGDVLELDKHPRWQRKKAEILERADFQCEHCGSADRNLRVHHSYYEKGKSPWEYPPESLRCLCEGCHAVADAIRRVLRREVGLLNNLNHLMQVLGYVRGLQTRSNPDVAVHVTAAEAIGNAWSHEVTEAFGDQVHEIAEAVGDAWGHVVAEGIGDTWGLSARQVIDAAVDGTIDGDTLEGLFEAKRLASSS